MLPRDWDPGGTAVPAGLEGLVFVTTDPDRVSRRVLDCVDRLPVVGRDAVKSRWRCSVGCGAPSCPGTCRRWRQA